MCNYIDLPPSLSTALLVYILCSLFPAASLFVPQADLGQLRCAGVLPSVHGGAEARVRRRERHRAHGSSLVEVVQGTDAGRRRRRRCRRRKPTIRG